MPRCDRRQRHHGARCVRHRQRHQLIVRHPGMPRPPRRSAPHAARCRKVVDISSSRRCRRARRRSCRRTRRTHRPSLDRYPARRAHIGQVFRMHGREHGIRRRGVRSVARGPFFSAAIPTPPSIFSRNVNPSECPMPCTDGGSDASTSASRMFANCAFERVAQRHGVHVALIPILEFDERHRDVLAASRKTPADDARDVGNCRLLAHDRFHAANHRHGAFLRCTGGQLRHDLDLALVLGGQKAAGIAQYISAPACEQRNVKRRSSA